MVRLWIPRIHYIRLQNKYAVVTVHNSLNEMLRLCKVTSTARTQVYTTRVTAEYVHNWLYIVPSDPIWRADCVHLNYLPWDEMLLNDARVLTMEEALNEKEV